jgi:hypothetical protein
MHNCCLAMVLCVVLLIACQPVTPLPIKTESTSPNLRIIDKSPTPPDSMSPRVLTAPSVTSVPAEILSSGPVEKNNNQTEIDLAISTVTKTIGTVTKSSKIRTNSAQSSPKITSKSVANPKSFDTTKIIGFAMPTLIQNLGRANMVRKEGRVEVWQYQFMSCVVDFFFYPIDEGSSQLILKNWDMRSTIMGGHLDRDSCRAGIDLYHQKFLSNPKMGR